MRRFILGVLALLFSATLAVAQTSIQQTAQRLDAAQFVAAGTNFNTVNQQSIATASVGAGLYAYITNIVIDICGDGTGTAATNVLFTSTGLAGAPSWEYSATTGTSLSTCVHWGDGPFPVPLKSSSPGTNVVITSPTAIAHTGFGIKIYYYLAP